MSQPTKRRCSRKITFPADPKSLADDLKAVRAAKALDAKHRAKLNSEQRKHLTELREKKQVGRFMLPDAQASKKGKQLDNWTTCPLLPGVPAVPPPKKPQPWEVLRCHESMTEMNELMADTDTASVRSPVIETMDDMSVDFIEGTPPELLVVSMSSKQKPLETVEAEIQFSGFTPQPSTSKPAASKLDEPYEIDADIEFELPDLGGYGSEIDADNDLGLWRPRVAEFETDEPDLEEVLEIDHEADAALRTMANPEEGDLLAFDWRSEIDNFTGVRETFTGPSGPTFDVSGQTPWDIFQKIWDTNIIDHIVQQTNIYAQQEITKVSSKPNSRMTRWRDTTVEEFWRFLGVIMLQSLFVSNVEREYWYPQMQPLRLGDTGNTAAYVDLAAFFGRLTVFASYCSQFSRYSVGRYSIF